MHIMRLYSPDIHSTDMHGMLKPILFKATFNTLAISIIIPVFILLWGITPILFAQEAPPTVEYQEIKTKYLPYNNPMQAWATSTGPSVNDTTDLIPIELQLDSFERDMMLRIANIYGTHVQALKAQVNNEPVEAAR